MLFAGSSAATEIMPVVVPDGAGGPSNPVRAGTFDRTVMEVPDGALLGEISNVPAKLQSVGSATL